MLENLLKKIKNFKIHEKSKARDNLYSLDKIVLEH